MSKLFSPWWPLLLAVAGAIAFGHPAHATDCPPSPLPLDEARAHIEKTPGKNAGLLWRIEKQGRTSWLYGTIHLMHIDFAKPGSQIMMGMRSSDVLAVELNTYEPQPPETDHKAVFQLTQAQRDRLLRAYEKDCIKADPSLSLLMPLLPSQAARQGLFWGYGPDARLMQIAKRSNKPIVTLENLAQQVSALTPASQADFDAQMDGALADIETGNAATNLSVLARAWQNNDLETFEKHTESMTSNDPASVHRLNDERNQKMARKIDALHTEGKRVFVAVGATHMTGPNSLPKLLQGSGFSVSFVPLKP